LRAMRRKPAPLLRNNISSCPAFLEGDCDNTLSANLQPLQPSSKDQSND
jgi:hypothetical protein